jgi:hypothetical protein
MTMLALVPGLAVHITAGSLGILTGAAALAVRKGDTLHRRFGTAFVASMMVMAGMGALLSYLLAVNRVNIVVGILTIYFVGTAWLAVRRPEGTVGTIERVALVVPISCATLMLTFGVIASNSPHGFDGYASVLYYAFGTFAALVSFADIRHVRCGGLSGTPRIVRHLWRMCVALFLASGSFFLGQQKVMPVAWHGSPVLTALALAPLVAMIFWLIRVRFPMRRNASAAAE